MPENLYCARRHVTRVLPTGELTGSSSLAASARASSDTITLDGHGLETDDPVTVRAIDDASLPPPLLEETVYYAIRLTSATLKLSATVGGAPINFTADGVEVVVRKEPAFDDAIEYRSRWADGFLPAHIVPLKEPIHPLIRGIVARLTAKDLLNSDGKSSEIVNQAEAAAQKQLERYAAGLPLRGAPVTASTNLAVVASAGSSDPRGWGSRRLP